VEDCLAFLLAILIKFISQRAYARQSSQRPATNGTAYALGAWLRGVIEDKWGKKSKWAYALLPTIALFLVFLVSSSLCRLAMFGYQLV
jgi:predicted MFS family arabinose efflux permease